MEVEKLRKEETLVLRKRLIGYVEKYCGVFVLAYMFWLKELLFIAKNEGRCIF